MKERDELQPIEVRCYPDRDDEFRSTVQEAVARTRHRITDSRRVLEAVRNELAEHYPAVVIHERDELADLGTGLELWYVYRDGRIAPDPDAPATRLSAEQGRERWGHGAEDKQEQIAG